MLRLGLDPQLTFMMGGGRTFQLLVRADQLEGIPSQGVPRRQLTRAEPEQYGAGDDTGDDLPGQIGSRGVGDGETERHQGRRRDGEPDGDAEADHGVAGSNESPQRAVNDGFDDTDLASCATASASTTRA
jgi:hypothetical protein